MKNKVLKNVIWLMIWLLLSASVAAGTYFIHQKVYLPLEEQEIEINNMILK